MSRLPATQVADEEENVHDVKLLGQTLLHVAYFKLSNIKRERTTISTKRVPSIYSVFFFFFFLFYRSLEESQRKSNEA
jgi:hypothetical protein